MVKIPSFLKERLTFENFKFAARSCEAAPPAFPNIAPPREGVSGNSHDQLSSRRGFLKNTHIISQVFNNKTDSSRYKTVPSSKTDSSRLVPSNKTDS